MFVYYKSFKHDMNYTIITDNGGGEDQTSI